MNTILPFRPISPEAKAEITSFTYHCPLRNCDFSFANMCSWQFLYQSEYAIVDDFLLIRFVIDSGRKAYMPPLGNGDLRHAIALLDRDAASLHQRLLLLGVSSETKELLESLYPGVFIATAERDYFDYIYQREALISLHGKRLQSKRNHINKFKSMFRFEYRPLTPEMAPGCLAVEERWCRANDCHEAEALLNERRAMTYALQHFKELGLLGGAILVDGEMAAFTYGSPINNDTFGVHVEKADSSIDGIYSVINQLFAAHVPEQYVYLNREEDLGIPGLRQAKLSYQPAILLEKYAMFKKGDIDHGES